MSTSNPRGASVVIVSVVFVILAAICISMRLYARLIVLKNSGYDELAISASFVCSIALLILTGEQVRYGEGLHYQAVIAKNPDDFTQQLKYLWISIIVYNASLCLTKISIILQYLRVFVGSGVRRACWATLAFVICYGIYTISISIFACIPISGFWSSTPGAHCVSKKFSWFFNASFNILSDSVILILPMPTLKSLKLPTRQKAGVMMIFALGGFVCLVSVLRLQSLYVISKSLDPTYDNVGASIWSNIEVYTGIICASLPAVKPVVGKLFPKLLSSTRSDTNRTNFPDSGFGNNSSVRPIRLHDVDASGNTVTRVQAKERRESDYDLRESSSSGNLGKDIFVATSMRQDVESNAESRSQVGSENDLIFQRP
ncbi:hypothetical protein NA56DRAFT_685042 [Hyaloscypha hepaticicola]|uniref:Rhodopsin domain-containing protein n=1 Tax=Hyaloscypha hepaticicola TaxID=2082293 RepID=A0A2J6QKF8_9HELO|nr:hypothetical protein NA56DRAFT_685042 [Hyaloscypha hepaticicola]